MYIVQLYSGDHVRQIDRSAERAFLGIGRAYMLGDMIRFTAHTHRLCQTISNEEQIRFTFFLISLIYLSLVHSCIMTMTILARTTFFPHFMEIVKNKRRKKKQTINIQKKRKTKEIRVALYAHARFSIRHVRIAYYVSEYHLFIQSPRGFSVLFLLIQICYVPYEKNYATPASTMPRCPQNK